LPYLSENQQCVKTLFALFLLLASLAVNAQTIKVFNPQRDGGGYVIYASNTEWYPVSVRFDFSNIGLRFSEGGRNLFVLPPRTDSFRIGELTPEPGASRWGIRYKYFTAMGDASLKNWDREYVYDLPFRKGEKFLLFQGYNGTFSHSGENALDFTMPEGTDVLAVREGTVVQVVQGNSRSCPSADCKQFNNYITILHPDGTFAYYGHIRQNGASVKPGDIVKNGDRIAASGNVGWSNGPHLHLAIFTGGFDRWNTLATRFRTDEGLQPVLLREGNSYSRNY
jgi:hypothetical protein